MYYNGTINDILTALKACEGKRVVSVSLVRNEVQTTFDDGSILTHDIDLYYESIDIRFQPSKTQDEILFEEILEAKNRYNNYYLLYPQKNGAAGLEVAIADKPHILFLLETLANTDNLVLWASQHGANANTLFDKALVRLWKKIT